MRSLAHAAENTETENLGKLLGAEGRLGVQVVEGVGLVASGFQIIQTQPQSHHAYWATHRCFQKKAFNESSDKSFSALPHAFLTDSRLNQSSV